MPAMKKSTDRNTRNQIRYLPESGSLLPGFPKIYSIIALQMTKKPQQANLLRFRTGEGILKLVITILAAALVLIILNLFSQVRSYRRIIQDEEDTRRRLAEGSINAMDFLKQYRDFKLEGIQKAGLTEEFARYEEIYRQEHA